MINAKFLKTQIKNSIWVAFGIAFVLIILSLGTMSFTPYFNDTTIKEIDGTISYAGAITLLSEANYFGLVGEMIAIAFGITLAIKLISVEISKGYMSSWLTLPMTRTSYFLSKIVAIFLAILMVILPNYLVQLMIAGLRYKDFNSIVVWTLTKLNLGLLLSFLFISSIAIFFATFFNRTSYAITLSIIIPMVFIVLFFIASNAVEMFNLIGLKNLKYATFFTLFDFNQIVDINNLQFIWKFILFFIFSVGLYIATIYWFKRKNLFI